MVLEPQVALVFGASRGIGRQICLSLAQAGYIVVLSSKSTGGTLNTKPDPNSAESTIDTVLREIEAIGGSGTTVACDVRSEAQIQHVFEVILAKYRRIDALIYNPGAIWWSAVQRTPTKRYRLMQDINVTGLYVAVQTVLPIFQKQKRGRIISISPPIYSRFTRGKTAYAMTKIAASVMTLGLAMDFLRPPYAESDLSISSLWPASAIQSAATRRVGNASNLRKATIFGDAIVKILQAPKSRVSGQLLLDEDFLREECNYTDTDIDEYAVIPGTKPRRIMPKVLPSLLVAEQDDEGDRIDSASIRSKL